MNDDASGMSDVPRMTLVVPVRRRRQFITNILPTALLNACRKDHEVIIVVDGVSMEYETARRADQCPDPKAALEDDERDRALVVDWLYGHRERLALRGVRIISFYADDSRYWTGGLRCAGGLNYGVHAATTEWIVGIGDEDLCFMPEWDKALWTTLTRGGRHPESTVATPTMVMPGVRDNWPLPLNEGWIHAQRAVCCHQLTFPITPQLNLPTTRISMASFTRFSQLASSPTTIEERCGQRLKTHWVPFLIKKSLLERVGGWPVSDETAFSFDIALDDALGAAGVVKVCPEWHHVLHMKQHLYMDETIDMLFLPPDLRSYLAHATIL